MNIELRHLRYFIAVAETLHFGRAAEKLHISQPPLSQQIQILEQQVGALLLERNNRNVRLTPAGRQFLEQAWQIMAQVNQAADRAARMHRGELGEVTIGFTASAPFIKSISASLLAFRQQHPDVHIQMVDTNTKQQIEPLLTGKLDIGIMRNTPLPDALDYQLLLREPLIAVVHQDHPLASVAGETITVRQLADEPIVIDHNVGAGVITGGRLLHGGSRTLVEIGHTQIDPDGRRCYCGNRGCLETVAGIESILEHTRQRLKRQPDSPLNGMTLSVDRLCSAALAGDRLAQEIITGVGLNVGRILAMMVNVFNPEKILVGSPLNGAASILYPAIQRCIGQQALPDYSRRIQIQATRFSNHGTMPGAALVKDALYDGSLLLKLMQG